MRTADAIAPTQTLVARAGRRLEVVTIGWNLVEAVVAVGAGVVAGSISLVGFGADSVIECLSGGVLLWRLRDGEGGERREQKALRLVGMSFLVLAAYVGTDAVRRLVTGGRAEASVVGVVVAALSLVVMPLLARAKRRVASELRSEALRADARQTDLCAYLSAILLLGLVLNAALGWWWADPVAALGMVPIIVREGLAGLRGRACTACHGDP